MSGKFDRIMIEIDKLTESDIGRWVFYNPKLFTVLSGRIKFWTNDFVFVVYNCKKDWDNFQKYIGCATRPEDLFFEND